MKAFFPETCPKYPRSVMRTGDGIPAGRVADGHFYLSPQPYVQLHESADVSQIEIVERSIFGRVGIDLSRVRVIEHIHEMQHLSCLLSCEHRTKFLNMHNNPIHIGLESPAPGMIRAAALSKLDELADGSPMPTDAIRPRNPLALILGETGKHDGCTRRRPSRRPRVHCTYVGDTGTAGSHRP